MIVPSQLPDGPLVVAVDTETSGLFTDDGARVSAVSVAWFEGSPGDPYGVREVVSYSWPFDQGMFGKGLHQPTLLEMDNPNLPTIQFNALLDWLGQRKLVMHNGKFDLTMLRAGTRQWPGRDLSANLIWDTQLACKELWPVESTSLKPTSVRLGLLPGGQEDAEQQALKAALKARKLTMGQFDRLPWEVVSEYSRVDAELTIRLWRHQVELFEAGEADWRLMQTELDLLQVLLKMECRGIGYDVQGSLAAARLIRRRMTALAAKLPFKATPAGARSFFFTEAGRNPAKRTPTGAPVVDEEQVRTLVRDGVKWAKEWAEYTKLTHAVGTWYEAYAEYCGPDGRLRTNYKQTRVVSGRMAAEHPNLQSIPKDDKMEVMPDGVPDVRDLFVARAGHQLWNLDLSQAELRVASHFAQCRLMLDLLAEGADLHGITCSEVLGAEPTDPDWKTKRDIAKRLTFGGIFQIGPKTFKVTLKRIADIDITMAQAQAYITRWRSMYPEFSSAYGQHERQAKQLGYVTLQSGRQSWFGPLDWPNTAWSRRVQGSLAEFNKAWLIQVERWTDEALVLNVHDSVLLELPALGADNQAHLVASESAALATEYFGIEMKVDVTPWRRQNG